MSNVQIAQTILEQIGGRKFISMTGAKNIMAVQDGLQFRIPGRGFAKAGINCVTITLNDADLYDVKYQRIHGTSVKLVKESKGIFADMLESDFETATGLVTRL